MIFTISVCGQILIVEHGGAAFQTVPLHRELWITSLVIGLVSIPVGATIRLIPDELVSLSSQKIKPSHDYNNTSNNQDVILFKGEQARERLSQQYTTDNEKFYSNEMDNNGVNWSIKVV
jgi:hypothetical protein